MPIHWVTRKQPITSANSASAEIHAEGDAVKDANLMQWVQGEIGLIVKWPYNLHIIYISTIHHVYRSRRIHVTLLKSKEYLI